MTRTRLDGGLRDHAVGCADVSIAPVSAPHDSGYRTAAPETARAILTPHPFAPSAMRLSDVLAPHVSKSSRVPRRGVPREPGPSKRIGRRDGIVQAVVVGLEKTTTSGSKRWTHSSRSSCTCPHFMNHSLICKHIWATILAAEAQGIPLIEPGAGREASGTANDRAVPLGDSITAHAVGDQIDDPLHRATDGALTVFDPEHDKHRHLAV